MKRFRRILLESKVERCCMRMKIMRFFSFAFGVKALCAVLLAFCSLTAAAVSIQMTKVATHLYLESLDTAKGVITPGHESTLWTNQYMRVKNTSTWWGFPEYYSIEGLLLSSSVVQAKPGYKFIGWAFDRSSIGGVDMSAVMVGSAGNPMILQSSDLVDGTSKYGGHTYFLPKENFYGSDNGVTYPLLATYNGVKISSTNLTLSAGVNMPSEWDLSSMPSDTYYAVFEEDLPPAVSLVSAAQRYPWNNVVDYTYALANLNSEGVYKIVTDVTFNSLKKSITNDVPSVDGTYSAAIDFDQYFDSNAVDSQTKLKLRLLSEQ